MANEMKLTRDNYYTPEADRAFLSCSQFESFLECEAAALAKIQGRYTPEPSKAFVVGNYFHTAFESPEAHEEFIQEHFREIYKGRELKSGEFKVSGKKADFELADRMIETAHADPAIRKLIDAPGENEMIMTGKLFGRYPWRIRLDKYIPDKPRMIIDWKTVADIRNRVSGKPGWTSFVEAYRYPFRAAVYMEIEKQFTGNKTDPAFWLVCISKQDPPDKEIVSMNDLQRQEYELEKVREKIWHIQQIKDGLAQPRRCGKCAYCRKSKKIKGVLDYWELEPDNAPEAEVDGWEEIGIQEDADL